MGFGILPFNEFVIEFDALPAIPEDQDRVRREFTDVLHDYFTDAAQDHFESGQDGCDGEETFLCLFASGEEFIATVEPEYEGIWMDRGPKFMQVVGIERAKFVECDPGHHRAAYKDYLKRRHERAIELYEIASKDVSIALQAYATGDYKRPVKKGNTPTL